MNKQASASLPSYFCIDLYKGTLSFSFLFFFCTEVTEMCFFISVVIFTGITEKHLPVSPAFLLTTVLHYSPACAVFSHRSDS